MAKSNHNTAALSNMVEAITEQAEKALEKEVAKVQTTKVGAKKKYNEVELRTKVKELVGHIDGVSAKIRRLNQLGWERGAIAVGLGKRYQHVRNVLTQPLKSSV